MDADSLYSVDINENKNDSDIQSIGAFRRVLPQVTKCRTYSDASTVNVLWSKICEAFRFIGKESHDFKYRWVCWVFGHCDFIINWTKQRIKSRWNRSNNSCSSIVVVYVSPSSQCVKMKFCWEKATNPNLFQPVLLLWHIRLGVYSVVQ